MDLLTCFRVQHHRRTIQGLDSAAAFAAGLVTGNAIGGIDFFTTLQDLRQGPNFGGIVHLGGHLLLLGCHPCSVIFSANYFDMNWHVGVFFATQLLALAVEITNRFSTEPGVTYETRNGILLNAQRRNCKSVNHIIGSCNDADFFVDWHNHRVINLEQVVINVYAFGAVIRHIALLIV